MAKFEATYPVAPQGLATSFTESETPLEYATEMRNRFINAAGGAEKRQGMVLFGAVVAGNPVIDGIHELIKNDGTAILLVSGSGSIWRYDSGVYTLAHTGLIGDHIHSMQMSDKLLFFNGVDRNIYTTDGITFTELKAINEKGLATAGTDMVGLVDGGIDNWVTDTRVTINDLVYNQSKDAYGIITAIATATVTHSIIASAGVTAATGIGVSTVGNSESGDNYQIIDLVELNVIPTDGDDDNLAIINSPSSAGSIAVSAVPDWVAAGIRVGDFVRNTTRGAVTRVTAVSTAAIGVVGVSGQTAGDSITLHKSAMPIAKHGHVHFGRLYMIDSRDKRLVRVTGPNDPEDLSTDSGTLNASSFKFGDQQPVGETILGMNSFQRFMVFGGEQNVYLYAGVDPIADTSSMATDFDIIGLFPQGAISDDALVQIGNDLAVVTPDGVQSISMGGDSSTLGRANLSEAIKTTLRGELKAADEEKIIAFHYTRRSWLLLKVEDKVYVFNYTAYLGPAAPNYGPGAKVLQRVGSWSLFDGKFAEQNAYFVRKDGTMLCAGVSGRVYECDVSGVYSDNGTKYSTEYETPWLTLSEPRRSVNQKQGHYIKPILETGGSVTYTITVSAGFEGESTDSIIVVTTSTASKTILNDKFPLRWRGEQARFNIMTSGDSGPDILSRYTIYASKHGNK